ncbi:MAG: hypothetical protein HYS44_02970 [Candidatus Niyogibacteria bacterium]|nr:hypothetical protein [Candidatus Niyogibacteria bacterium]
MKNLVVAMVMLCAIALLATPIVYMFLQLASWIGPERRGDAIFLGIVLWFIGGGGFYSCLEYISNLLKENPEDNE